MLLVVRNERGYIGPCLEALLANRPREPYEIIVVDGLSEDGTLSEVADVIKGSTIPIRVLTNPKKTLASGWNIGIREAKGDYIVRIDARTLVQDSFLELELSILEEHPEVACCGGVLVTRGSGLVGKAIAAVVSHPLGVGNSRFRTASEYCGYADTVPYGMYRREVFQTVGLLDERLERGQDLDLHTRMRSKGMKFWLDSRIKTVYYARTSLRGLMTKALGDGYWSTIAAVKNRGRVPLRNLAPLAFLVYTLLASILTLLVRFPLVWLPGLLYSLLMLGAGLQIAVDCGLLIGLVAIPIFPLYHLARGWGSLRALISGRFREFLFTPCSSGS